ncbi:tRNA lysidine(34) synthetase TilS [Muriicola sp. Z0-33]|uniref:tRNA lysidine(34) synthetase TilS n=1 Tax=Muriicola sp. Z0-33 TaxID=2816957 RepID=UPI0022389D5D|nr:tRNA lysidine(34) synthetase TilS [Muriicola sp. Z0-33]MCW5515448.1 tRNA lysidine(34) synthetase TilS [Muriicola sp. Z0-33]
MLSEFKKHIEYNFPALLQSPFLLACSGGIDSVVLAHLCAACNLKFALVHCNFRLRGEESDADEEFVKALSKELNLKYFVKGFDTEYYANLNKVSVQMAARDLRYSWFEELRGKEKYSYLVTAHQADDNLETFLINLSRGTGIEGLNGITERSSTILRPLLVFTRQDIQQYATKNKLSWREDSSNDDRKYLRNKIRHEIVPKLKELHPTFDKNFAKTLKYLAGTSALVDEHISDLKKTLLQPHKDHYRISVKELSMLSPLEPHIHAIFKEFGFTQWEDILGLLTTLSGKEVRSGTHRLIKDRDELLLQELKPGKATPDMYFLDDPDSRPPLQLLQQRVNEISETADTILYVDKETLNDRLSVRKWQNGDYFYPLGMKGKKKVAKFFKDEKMDLIAKEAQWLLCSGNDIVWVIGRRADDRFKVTGKTKKILKITWVE